MNLRLSRFSTGPDSTLGLLSIAGKFACFTIEDQRQAVKVPSETRIPAGTYEVRLRTIGGFHFRYLARFPEMHDGMLWLQNVPGFEYILIHCGNTDEDSAGCILVGDGVHENITTRGYLNASQSAYERIYPRIAKAVRSGEAVSIEVVDGD